jgi:hypothetical protein
MEEAIREREKRIRQRMEQPEKMPKYDMFGNLDTGFFRYFF